MLVPIIEYLTFGYFSTPAFSIKVSMRLCSRVNFVTNACQLQSAQHGNRGCRRDHHIYALFSEHIAVIDMTTLLGIRPQRCCRLWQRSDCGNNIVASVEQLLDELVTQAAGCTNDCPSLSIHVRHFDAVMSSMHLRCSILVMLGYAREVERRASLFLRFLG